MSIKEEKYEHAIFTENSKKERKGMVVNQMHDDFWHQIKSYHSVVSDLMYYLDEHFYLNLLR